MQRNNSPRQLLISAGLVILVIVLLLVLVDVGAVIEMLLLADWRMLLLATAFLIAGFGLTTLRTRYILGNKPGYLDTLKVDGSGMMLGVLIQFPSSAYRVVTMDRTTEVKASEARGSSSPSTCCPSSCASSYWRWASRSWPAPPVARRSRCSLASSWLSPC